MSLHQKSNSFIFFGTSEFAIPSLEALLEEGYSIPLVVTTPDKPKGRGLKLLPTPVKEKALELKLKLFQPESLKSSQVVDFIKSHNADGMVVVSYGKIIPPEIFRSFRLGGLNVHPSLLPKYRGPAPIQRAILNGEEVTGVTIMLIDEGVDSGPVLSVKEVPIEPFESYGSLADKLSKEGAKLLIETLPGWISRAIEPVSQKDREATYAEPIRKEETLIDWSEKGVAIVRKGRAFDPRPGAYTLFKGKRIKCYELSMADFTAKGEPPGKVLGISKKGLLVKGGDDSVVVIGSLQRESKQKMPASEFVKGHPDLVGSVMGV